MCQKITNKYNLSSSAIRHIYLTYLKLISDKALEVTNSLKENKELSKNEMYYNRGDYCFYLRYLGKYYINYKAYQKWKSKISKK